MDDTGDLTSSQLTAYQALYATLQLWHWPPRCSAQHPQYLFCQTTPMISSTKRDVLSVNKATRLDSSHLQFLFLHLDNDSVPLSVSRCQPIKHGITLKMNMVEKNDSEHTLNSSRRPTAQSARRVIHVPVQRDRADDADLG
jgi:hypothetical protein